jgi:putative salt-induced outer membrane protein
MQQNVASRFQQLHTEDDTMKQLSTLALGCIFAVGSFAQAPPPKTDGQWRGLGGAALSATSGNTSNTNFLLNSDLTRATENDKISLGAAANYGTSKKIDKATGENVKETTSSKWTVFGQYDFNITPVLYAFGKLGFEGDKATELSLRTSLAGGLGYKIINTAENTFNVFGGLAYTTDKYSDFQIINGKEKQRFSRASVLLGEESTHSLTSTVAVKQRLELYPGLSGDKAFLAKFNAGLSVAMSTTLSLNVGVTDTYNSKPALGNKKNDLGLFTGVNVKFGAL